MPHDSFRHAAHQRVKNCAATVRSHDDQIDVVVFRKFENLYIRIAPFRTSIRREIWSVLRELVPSPNVRWLPARAAFEWLGSSTRDRAF